MFFLIGICSVQIIKVTIKKVQIWVKDLSAKISVVLSKVHYWISFLLLPIPNEITTYGGGIQYKGNAKGIPTEPQQCKN